MSRKASPRVREFVLDQYQDIGNSDISEIVRRAQRKGYTVSKMRVLNILWSEGIHTEDGGVESRRDMDFRRLYTASCANPAEAAQLYGGSMLMYQAAWRKLGLRV